jgi:hypothetical protein
MTNLSWALTWIVTIGAVEAFFKPVSKRVLRLSIDRIAPTFFLLVDDEARRLLATGGSSQELHAHVRRRLWHITGEEWSEATLQPLWAEVRLEPLLDRFSVDSGTESQHETCESDTSNDSPHQCS